VRCSPASPNGQGGTRDSYCVWSLASQASRILCTRQHFWNSWEGRQCELGPAGLHTPQTLQAVSQSISIEGPGAVTPSQPQYLWSPPNTKGRCCPKASKSHAVECPEKEDQDDKGHFLCSSGIPWASSTFTSLATFPSASSVSRRNSWGPQHLFSPSDPDRLFPVPGKFVLGPKLIFPFSNSGGLFLAT
jgi:hypothetical protein